MNKFFAILAMLVVFAGSAQAQVALNETTAQKLNDNEVASMWSQVGQVIHHESGLTTKSIASPTIASPTISVQQAQATIEVFGVQSITATFVTLVPLPEGTTVAFRLTLPNGIVIPMEGFRTGREGTYSSTLWNGPFPGIWPSGTTLFEAVMIQNNGIISYVSAYVPVRSCCALTGPLVRADVSFDGTVINLSGYFGDDTVVTLNGQRMPIPYSFGYSSFDGLPIFGIYIGGIGQEGQMNLIACSRGLCSNRVVYITRPGAK